MAAIPPATEKTPPGVHRIALESIRGSFSLEEPTESIAFAVLLVLVALAPAPAGSVQPVPTALLCLGASLVAFLSFVSTRSLRLPMEALPLLAGLLGLAALGLLQLVPLPEGVLSAVAPGGATAYRETRELLQLFSRAGAAVPRISLAPWETAWVAVQALSYAALAASTALLLHGRSRRRVFWAVLLAVFVGYALTGATKTNLMGRVAGPFVNPNHFAGYLLLGAALAFGTLRVAVLRGHRAPDVKTALEKRLPATAGAALTLAALLTTLGLTGSRGGIVAAAFGVVSLVGLAAAHRRRSHRSATVARLSVGLLLVLVFVSAAAGRAPLMRFLDRDLSDLGQNGRTTLWKASAAAFADSPLLGGGLGAFRESFRRHQPRAIRGLVENAHCEPIHILVTGGVVGAVVAAWAAFGTLAGLLRGFLRQRHREESSLLLAAAGGLAAVLLHGLVDFDLSIPAIPITLAALVGAAWAAIPSGVGQLAGVREAGAGPSSTRASRTDRDPLGIGTSDSARRPQSPVSPIRSSDRPAGTDAVARRPESHP